MPYGDGTGPLGQGSRTGRGAGRCRVGFGPGNFGQAINGGAPRFGRFPQISTATQAPDSAQERIAALECEVAELKEQLRKQ